MSTVGSSSSPLISKLGDGLLGLLDSIGASFTKLLLGIVANFWNKLRFVAIMFALLAAAIWLAFRRSSWTQPVRLVLARQLQFTAVDAIPVVLRFGGVSGILMITQAAIWTNAYGISSDLIVPILRQGIVRELAPLLACLVVIGRSGVAIATELATMTVSGEMDVLESQGIDPMTSIVMPRVISVTVSTVCLAVLMAVTIVVSGYLIGWAIEVIRVPFRSFIYEFVKQLDEIDLLFFTVKTTVAGALAGVICCQEGMNVKGALTDVPLVSSRSGIRALTAVIIVSTILSVLTYRRLLVFDLGRWLAAIDAGAWL